MSRYRKQTLFEPIGEAGQEKIRSTRVLLVGCGALGSVIADSLTRAGVGGLRIVDRDFVDLSNLQRQVLFDEADVRSHQAKAIAAVAKLRAINADVSLEAEVADVTAGNIGELVDSCDLIMDGTDNFETRYLINDVSLEMGIPWISGGVLGASGQVFSVIPGQTACLRCITPEPPPQTDTCDTAGVLGPAVNIVASLQVLRALQWMTAPQSPNRTLTVVDAWTARLQTIDLTPLLSQTDCPACHRGERLWLRGQTGSQSLILCGRNAVQISPSRSRTLDLCQLELTFRDLGDVRRNPFLLWFQPAEFPTLELHLFGDGRAIIKGTEDLAAAKTVYDRYVGS